MKNKTCWKDDTGAVIQAHGGTILQYKDTWYWYGENKDAETINRRVKFIGFSCYSSKDLEHWHNEGLVLKASDDPEDDLYETCIAERPSVIYNKKTKKFILWFHLDNRDYTMASVGLAVSDFATGSFRYLGRQRPLGRDSRDLTVFQGNDEKAYLVHSSDWNSTMIIDRLDEDYTGFTGETTSICIDQYREAPVVMEYGSKYYMVTSGCTGWLPNSMLYAESDCMMGRWRLIDNPCSGRDYRKTFQGQSTFAFCKDEQWILALDHWYPQDLKVSGYSFLPVDFDNDMMSIAWCDTYPYKY